MHRLDDLDVRIFKELGSPSSPQWNIRETYSNIARRIGVDEETVRRRLKRAQKLGSVPGWRMMINPHLLGCEAACLDLEVENEEAKDKTVSEVSKIYGVIKILDFRGKGLQVTLYHANDDALTRMTKLIGSICHSSLEPTMWEMRFPRSDIRMTRTDWKIIEAMLEDARKNLDDVSKSGGVSVRTVERRLTLMSEERAVYLQGTPNFRNFAGLSCVFLVFCPDGGRKKKAVDEIVLSKVRRIELSNTTANRYSTFVMVFDNLSEADEFVQRVKGIDGVTTVRMGIMKDLIVVQDWLREEVRGRIHSF